MNSLHHQALVADTHNDLLCSVVIRPPHRWGSYFRERWLPQLTAGGVDVQVLPVFVDDLYRPEGALRQTLRMIEAAHRIAEENADAVTLRLDGQAVRETCASGRIALVLALESCPAVDADLELIASLHRLGVRIASLTHFGRSVFADGSAEDDTGSRLTSLGVAAVAEFERLGIILDISHLGRGGVDHALELSSRPVLATHSSARALRDHHRNLDDEQLAAVAKTGGVVCVNFYPGFVDATEPTVARLADHFEHIAAVAGIDHVGLGPDFITEVERDITLPGADPWDATGWEGPSDLPDIAGPADLPVLTDELLARGLPEDDVVKILGGNVLRLFDAELGRPQDEER
jgi:membrane dipeptidase